jgi:hypothetical protein
MPEYDKLPAAAARQLESYVRGGGCLLTSGSLSPELRRLAGLKNGRGRELNDGHVIRRDDQPSGVFARWDRYQLAGARQLYPLYLSWDQFNPRVDDITGNWPIHGLLDEEHPEKAGCPAATIRRVGKGVVVHLATQFFTTYGIYANPDMLAWLREVMNEMIPDPMIACDAPSFVELAARRRDDTLLVHLVNGNPGRDTAWVFTSDWWVDEIPPVGPVNLKIRCDAKPGRVTWEPSGEPLESTFSKGVLSVTVPRLEIHGCVKVQGWTPGK